MSMHINDNGVIKECKPYINVDGVIHEVKEGWVNENGVLRQFYASATDLILLGSAGSANNWTVTATNGTVTAKSDTLLSANASYSGNGSADCKAVSISVDFSKYSKLEFSGTFNANGSNTTIRTLRIGTTDFTINQGTTTARQIDISAINTTGNIRFQTVGGGPAGGTSSFSITSVKLIP